MKKSSNPPQPPQPPKGLIKTGHAIIVPDKASGGVKWHTFGAGDEIGESLDLNAPLVFPPTAFQMGTRIEIFEEVP